MLITKKSDLNLLWGQFLTPFLRGGGGKDCAVVAVIEPAI